MVLFWLMFIGGNILLVGGILSCCILYKNKKHKHWYMLPVATVGIIVLFCALFTPINPIGEMVIDTFKNMYEIRYYEKLERMNPDEIDISKRGDNFIFMPE